MPTSDQTRRRFDRIERSRILTLRRLADFLDEKVQRREAAGETPHRTRQEVAAIRWALRTLGADDVVSRRDDASHLPGEPGRRSDHERRDEDGGG